MTDQEPDKKKGGDSQSNPDDEAPAAIRGDRPATAFWGVSRRELEKAGVHGDELPIEIARKAADIVRSHRRVGWQHDRDVQNRIRNAIDDFFFNEVRLESGATLKPEVIDSITDAVLAAARAQMADDGPASR